MEQENKPRWQELCAQATVEQDSKKLLALVTEINRLLDADNTWNRETTEPDHFSVKFRNEPSR